MSKYETRISYCKELIELSLVEKYSTNGVNDVLMGGIIAFSSHLDNGKNGTNCEFLKVKNS